MKWNEINWVQIVSKPLSSMLLPFCFMARVRTRPYFRLQAISKQGREHYFLYESKPLWVFNQLTATAQSPDPSITIPLVLCRTHAHNIGRPTKSINQFRNRGERHTSQGNQNISLSFSLSKSCRKQTKAFSSLAEWEREELIKLLCLLMSLNGCTIVPSHNKPTRGVSPVPRGVWKKGFLWVDVPYTAEERKPFFALRDIARGCKWSVFRRRRKEGRRKMQIRCFFPFLFPYPGWSMTRGRCLFRRRLPLLHFQATWTSKKRKMDFALFWFCWRLGKLDFLK